MRLEPIVARLREAVPALRTVGGALQLTKLTTTPVTPAAYVVPLRDAPTPNLAVNAVRQQARVEFAVVIAVQDVSRPGGEAAFDDVLDALRADIRTALLGWEHPDSDDVMTATGGQLLFYDGGTLFWSDEYVTTVQWRNPA